MIFDFSLANAALNWQCTSNATLQHQAQKQAAEWSNRQFAMQSAFAMAQEHSGAPIIDGTCEEVPETKLLEASR